MHQLTIQFDDDFARLVAECLRPAFDVLKTRVSAKRAANEVEPGRGGSGMAHPFGYDEDDDDR